MGLVHAQHATAFAPVCCVRLRVPQPGIVNPKTVATSNRQQKDLQKGWQPVKIIRHFFDISWPWLRCDLLIDWLEIKQFGLARWRAYPVARNVITFACVWGAGANVTFLAATTLCSSRRCLYVFIASAPPSLWPNQRLTVGISTPLSMQRVANKCRKS